MLTLRRKVAAFAISASLVAGGAGVLAPAASAVNASTNVHVNNVRVCNNCGDVNINVNWP